MTIINSTAVSATFNIPSTNGNSPIRYYVLMTNNVIIANGKASPITVTGLSSVNTAFTVAAVNDVGLGATSEVVYSTPSNTPVNLSVPVVSGSLVVGTNVSTTNGTWSHSIGSYSYQWQAAGSNISGATSSSYTLTSSEENKVIRCIVTANSSTTGISASANSANTSSVQPFTVEYLVVAGGGGGGGNYGGGAGAGGLITGSFTASFGVLYTVTVGSGGSGANLGAGGNGFDSSFHTYTANGGGGGGGYQSGVKPGKNGGSGGGGSSGGGGPTGSTTPAGTGIAGQGFDGGTGSWWYAGGGGGGASQTGRAGFTSAPSLTPNIGGNGGIGVISSITGSSVGYAGGGGGSGSTIGQADVTYGGSNGSSQNQPAPHAVVNRGGGGGGGQGTGGNGGSGFVCIRYPSTLPMASNNDSGTYSVSGGYRIYYWTGIGSITF